MKIAFVFPGQGSQAVGMLDSFAGNTAVDEALAEASAAVGQDLHLDQSIARAALPGAGCPLALQTEDLTVDQAGRDFHIKSPPFRQGQPLTHAGDRLYKVDRQAVVQILSAPVCTRLLATPEEFRERIACIDEIGEAPDAPDRFEAKS